jgi:uncharacterized protein (TIRG00374 family)
MAKKTLKILICWGITILALYYALRSTDWGEFWSHVKEADKLWLLLAVGLTGCSYVFRSRRWQFLFPEKSVIGIFDSWRVLKLGFFMNNVLPARAGEIVRAHMGSKTTGLTRTLVLATIASERLLDGLALSLFFVIFSLGLGKEELSTELLYVAYVFAAASLAVGIILFFREPIFKFIERINGRFGGKAATYTLQRVKIFIEGLAPLFQKNRIGIIVLWSIFIWFVELGVFTAVGVAYGVHMEMPFYVLFMVAVNFSSLIPAAPGGIGVIEAVVKTVLMSVGIAPELALAMVITQHVIQYTVVGIPGAAIMLTWKEKLQEVQLAEANS